MSPAPLTPWVMWRRRQAFRLMDVALRLLPKADRPAVKKAIQGGIRDLFSDRIVFVDAPEGIPTKPRTMTPRG